MLMLDGDLEQGAVVRHVGHYRFVWKGLDGRLLYSSLHLALEGRCCVVAPLRPIFQTRFELVF